MPTKLGGGQLGCIVQVVTVTEYVAIPNTASFVQSTDPGVFQAYRRNKHLPDQPSPQDLPTFYLGPPLPKAAKALMRYHQLSL